MKYAIGVDFGTESGRARLGRCRHRPRGGDCGVPLLERGHRRDACRKRVSRLRLTGRCRTRRTTFARFGPPSRRCSRTPVCLPSDVIGVGIDFTACTMLPVRVRWDTALHAARVAWRAARLGEALEAPRRTARGGRDQPRGPGDGASLAQSLRWEDLLGVVLFQVPADLERSARGLRRRRSADRGGRLGRLAADGRRDPQLVYGRLQGAVVQARRLSSAGVLRRPEPRVRHRRRSEDVA